MLNSKFALVFLLFLAHLSAKAKIEFNKNNQQAFENILNLKLPKANEILDTELSINPQNVYTIYLKGLSEVIQVFINENDKSYKLLQKSLPEKLKQIEKHGGKSAYTHFFKGQLLFYYGLTQAKFDDLFSSGTHIRDAYLILKNNATKYPNFLPNNTVMGVIETFSGTVPNSFKWLINMFGVKASITNGMKRIDKMASANTSHESDLEYFKLEAKIFQGGLYHLVLHDEKKGWGIINSCTNDFKTNLLSNYLRASFLIKTGENEKAISILLTQPKGKDYVEVRFLDYLLGVAKLNRLDKDADKYLISFLKYFKGRNYLKSAAQKLAWYYLIHDDFVNYHHYMNKISKIGVEFTDEDKQAAKNFTSKNIPNISLLRARLLFDGGYYDRSYKELEGKSTKNYSDKKDQVEFIYRLARIYQKQEKYQKAIIHFNKVILIGRNSPHYYAMASSIEIGLIYEILNDKVNAHKYYTKALTFTKNKEYINSLEQRANAGINRTKKQ
jgi:tetratricopeptide (TPR) repeat protein